jgi:tRNA (guanosine-2'-O-)-methyltransferase|tara:strand:+ start:210 stop:899 length:690 start_codon:yes stop_codon:yes gene_type:complete
MESSLKLELIEHLSQFLTEERLHLFQEKLKERSNRITLVLEDVFQSRNISAAMRSADCFGIQNIHIIENKNNFVKDKSVSLGAGKWINIKQYNTEENNTINCLKKLKKEGYQIIATSPHNTNISLEEIDVKNNKIAIILGTELTGLSEKALSFADKRMKINMYGFTESLNISVSAAICCQSISSKMRKETTGWEVTEEEKTDILLNWIRNSIKSGKQIEEKFLDDKSNK